MTKPSARAPAVDLERLDDDGIWRVTLDTPKANILDMEKVEQLRAIFARGSEAPGLKAILIEGRGPHFSFGASVEEHLPETCAAMIHGFHALFRAILDSRVVTLAAVRGQCLGGALELASFCHRVFAAPDARLGQPEIVLGVFAPVASVALAERIGRGAAEDLCLSGRSVEADEALRMGLVDEVAADPGAAALDWARRYLTPRSASSLRRAVRAVRWAYARRFGQALEEVERLYLEDLMATHDAVEGLQAFLDKRRPQWTDA